MKLKTILPITALVLFATLFFFFWEEEGEIKELKTNVAKSTRAVVGKMIFCFMMFGFSDFSCGTFHS